MALVYVEFEYLTGLRQPLWASARLSGSWDAQGAPTDRWSSTIMQPFTADDGCPAFRAVVPFDDSRIGQEYRWGVTVAASDGADLWGIATEVGDPARIDRHRTFTLRATGQTERYYLTHCRRLGANKVVRDGQPPAIRFAVWAPNALNVDVVCGLLDSGYIWDDGRGVSETFPMRRDADGIWSTRAQDSAALADFARFDHMPYMFRVTRDDNSVVYRTDLYSRCQIGSGGKNPDAPHPGQAPWDGTRQDVDGSKSCSVVIDPGRVCEVFQELDEQRRPVFPEQRWLSEDDFWRDEYAGGRPLPARVEDLVIYELHVNGLGVDRGADAGTLEDAMNLLPYLRDLGVNCVGLMPFSEFQDRTGWGYSTSHYFAIEYSGGGRDKFKHFVRECHRNGMAVLLDVVYNHYTFDAERAEWAYDSSIPERNIYYWYEGRPGEYAEPTGGYLDNGSSGWAPRFWEENVRKLFTSSAAALLSEFHFDGFRVDLTQALHRDNTRHADQRPVGSANQFGQKFLREWSNTLRLIRPDVLLIAEDHTGWQAVSRPTDDGGLGFDAPWYADYYHHLIGDSQDDPGRARLLALAGLGGDDPLHMTWFAGALQAGAHQVVYHESHDEAGNAQGSARTIAVAVNGAPLVGQTRRYAEARVRFTAGMTLLGPGTPMFFMGEEVGASQPYRYVGFDQAREDYFALREGAGANLFRFYADIIRLRLASSALRSRDCEILHVHDENRVIAFRRWAADADEEMIVIGSLNNQAFPDGYRIGDSPATRGGWREVFNSDAVRYGGGGMLNDGELTSADGAIDVRIPANSVLVLRRP